MDLDRFDFIVIFGKTGTGKSEMLNSLEELGQQVLVLQDLAGHKGSAFGGLDEKKQPGQKEFEEIISNKINSFSPGRPVWTEFEGSYLGRLQVPEELLGKLMKSGIIIVKRDRPERIDRIVNEYTVYGKEKLLSSAGKLKKKLSSKAYRNLRKAIHVGDYDRAVSFLLGYYDRVYEALRKKWNGEIIGEFDLSGSTLESNVKSLLRYHKAI